ncbi:MAG: hypothetical protein OXL37_05220 [Chloroflexota bacterium]|nr:hypothetical protein [Chloroflexota bacterium]MDE2959709.1 hypothetical protein [Chloroflexota bacterium]
MKIESALLPENIRSLLDRADLSLLRGKHGEASTFFWKATEAAIEQAASARGHKLRSLDYDDVEPFIDSLDQQLDPGVGLMAAYLITLEYQRNSDGDLLDLEDVVFYQPVVHSFIIDLLAMAE